MAKFYGKVGYCETVETAPGVFSETITEKKYYGDVTRNSRRLSKGEGLNDDITVGNNISIVADAYAYEHFFAIRYVEWAGARWKVDNVEVKRPRLQLTLGGVWHGDESSITSEA